MPEDQVGVLRRWAHGDFYPLSPEELGPNALDKLAEEMGHEPIVWWRSLYALLLELDEEAVHALNMPLAALLDVGGEQLVNEVASIAHRDPKVASAFWDAMHFLQRSSEAYRLLGRRQTIEAFVRHVPRIPRSWKQPIEVWEDGWADDVFIFLNEEDPDEVWALALDLLKVSAEPAWSTTIGAFIVEELLRDHGDAFIERIEAEAATNDRLKRSLPITRWAVPEHLLPRVEAAAGRYWDDRPNP
ncbi:MAG TPA: hypothetical protein VEL12_01140 [Candidatus Nitrosopolaris sp.]|nr:hypothetical protein [Candidatus Nitrosopolaris sp.]